MSTDFTEKEAMDFISDTSKIFAETQARNISNALISAQSAGSLTNNVEFWKWVSQNYKCLTDSQAIQQVAANNPAWLQRTVLQGKGYEWDFMASQRSQLKNLFSRFDAGTSATQPGYDIVQTNVFNGKVIDKFQNKAYTSSTTPHLENTTKDIKVVTNAENVSKVQDMGYDTVSFQDSKTIKSQTKERFEQAKKGTANTTYTFKGVAGTMAKAGLVSAVIGMGTEALFSYKKFKNNELSKEEYVKEILKSGGSAGITGAATTGIMIPISAAVTAAGVAQPWLIPISFVVSAAIDKIVSPCFGRGDYLKQLNQAKYYQNLADMQVPLMNAIEDSMSQFETFINTVNAQRQQFVETSAVNNQLNEVQRRGNEVLKDKTAINGLNDLIAKI